MARPIARLLSSLRGWTVPLLGLTGTLSAGCQSPPRSAVAPGEVSSRGRIEGTVINAAGAPADSALVVVRIPALGNAQAGSYQAGDTRTSRDGRFSLPVELYEPASRPRPDSLYAYVVGMITPRDTIGTVPRAAVADSTGAYIRFAPAGEPIPVSHVSVRITPR